MNTFVTFVEPLLNGAFGTCRLQKLQLHFAHFEEGGLHFLVFNDLCLVALESKNVFEIRQHLFDALHGNAEMFNL